MSNLQKSSTLDVLIDFINTSLDDLLAGQHAESAEEQLLSLFQYCAQQVPAYKQFLALHQVNPDQITNYLAFQSLPLISKSNYMQVYSLPARCLDGHLNCADRIAVSSGSTGQPTFWPRSAKFELDVAVRFEQVFVDSFHADQQTTLAVVCFALGNWVGGLFTTSCCWHLATKGYTLMVATPGNQKAEIFRVVQELAPHYAQTVLLGYPPFLKDVIDAGLAEGINWAAFNTKLVFAGEVFSEEWRSLVAQRVGSTQPCFDTASLYGTADGGVLGNETPLSIAIRRWLAQHPQAAHSLFGESRLPTLVQYDPHSRYFEVQEGMLVISAFNSVPLIRYGIADKGGLISYEDMWVFLGNYGITTFNQLGLPYNYQARQLPFVFVFGRIDFTVSYYGANIFPENIAVGLEQAKIMDWVTGKFVLGVRENQEGNSVLHIAVELLPNVLATDLMPFVIANSIRTQLLRLNSEFANYLPMERQLPQVSLHRFGDPEYFPVGVKHRYTVSAFKK